MHSPGSLRSTPQQQTGLLGHSTGSSAVDTCLSHCRPGTVSELCGPSACGKTQGLIALSLSASSAVFLSCSSPSMPIPHYATEDQLSRITDVGGVTSPHELHAALSELISLQESNTLVPSLVAIDGLSTCVAPPPPWASVQQASSLARLMKVAAVTNGAAVVYTNHSSTVGGSFRPGLGAKWLAVPHARALLCPDGSVHCLAGAHAGFSGTFRVRSTGCLE